MRRSALRAVWFGFLVAGMCLSPRFPDCALGGAPTSLGLRAMEIGHTRVRLTWKAASGGEVGYRLERRQGESDWQEVAVLPLGTRTGEDGGLEPDSDYQYRLSTVRSMSTEALRGGQPAAHLSLSLGGAQEIRLYVDEAGDGNSWDHSVWGSPALERADGSTVPLSELKPTRFRTGWGGDREPKAFTIAGREYARSLWAHAPSVISYVLEDSFDRFEAWVGVADSAEGRGSVRFKVEVYQRAGLSENEVTVRTKGWLTSKGGTAYYLDSARGRDANDGASPDRAWATLDRASAMIFAPGDKLLLRAGTRYQGQLSLHGSGAEGKPSVVGKFGEGVRPRIDAEGRTNEAIKLHNVEWWELSDLEITNTGETPKPGRAGVVISLWNFGTAHHIELMNLYVHDVNGSNVKNEGGGSGIAWRNGGDQVKSRFDGLAIQGCHLVRTDRNGITGWSDHWTRQDWFPSLNVVIRGNVLEDIGGDGIVPIGCDGCLIEYNVLNGGRTRAQDYAAGIWPWSCDNTVVQFNEVSGMKGTADGQGFDSDWNCRNSLFQYNYSHDNEGGFILICNDGSSRPPYNSGNIGTVVRYNISQNDGARTFQISAVEDALIYNNTIYVGKEQDIFGVFYHDWSGWAKNTRFYNNIFYAEGKVRYEFGQSQGNVFEGNVFYGGHENPPPDAKAITTDPMLAAPGSGGPGLAAVEGYRLKKGSPCVGAGVVVANNGGRDYWGNPVPEGQPPDIGAWQSR